MFAPSVSFYLMNKKCLKVQYKLTKYFDLNDMENRHFNSFTAH